MQGNNINIIFRYPSLLAISPKKSLYSRMRGSMTKPNVDRFLSNLLNGKE